MHVSSQILGSSARPWLPGHLRPLSPLCWNGHGATAEQRATGDGCCAAAKGWRNASSGPRNPFSCPYSWEFYGNTVYICICMYTCFGTSRDLGSFQLLKSKRRSENFKTILTWGFELALVIQDHTCRRIFSQGSGGICAWPHLLLVVHDSEECPKGSGWSRRLCDGIHDIRDRHEKIMIRIGL